MEYHYNQIRIELGALATGMFYTAQMDRINSFNRIRQIMYRKIEGKELTQKSEKKNKSEPLREVTQLSKRAKNNKIGD